MKGRELSFIPVVESLRKKHDIKIFVHQKRIALLKNNSSEKKFDLGNKSWGKIDYLIKKHRFHIFYYPSFN